LRLPQGDIVYHKKSNDPNELKARITMICLIDSVFECVTTIRNPGTAVQTYTNNIVNILLFNLRQS